jgi:hypothetical protein
MSLGIEMCDTLLAITCGYDDGNQVLVDLN